jgi:hypothetical protein
MLKGVDPVVDPNCELQVGFEQRWLLFGLKRLAVPINMQGGMLVAARVGGGGSLLGRDRFEVILLQTPTVNSRLGSSGSAWGHGWVWVKGLTLPVVGQQEKGPIGVSVWGEQASLTDGDRPQGS